MKSTNVLLLELDPSWDLCRPLREILGSASRADIQLQQETPPHDDPLSYAENVLPEVVSRYSPAVSFLVSPWSALEQIKAFLPLLRGRQSSHHVVVVSDAQKPDEMFEVIQLGAADFITPPLTPTGILPRLWRLLDQTSAGNAAARLLKEKLRGTHRMIGESPTFKNAVSRIPLIAKCDATILISGETGTGKEVCAKAIHELSRRADGPFIAVNCGAIPVELIENELFGHERGAYTNAASSQFGQIQAAEGGTLFLDEIDALPLLAQVKLLRFLQEKEYKPLGSANARRADVHVITATGMSVDQAVEEGRLRRDLYYRLNILPIVLPPLRERREDIPLLAMHFLGRYARQYGKHINGFSADAMQKLMLHYWPGNVRELEHAIIRSIVLSEDSIIRGKEVLIGALAEPPQAESFKTMKARVVGQAERTYLTSLLIAHRGNITKAAEGAQKNRRAFFELLRKHHIDPREFKTGG
jgi:two-component system response regulator GlrR